ncbi:MAG TPA: hypothetical protein VMF69_14040, partial [Gemmataceae bacterium]|nr:hypothetical protein [Gemmataceae bacterium]
ARVKHRRENIGYDSGPYYHGAHSPLFLIYFWNSRGAAPTDFRLSATADQSGSGTGAFTHASSANAASW